jgi:hypothetical protein
MQPAVWRGQRKSVKRASGGEFLLGSGGIVSSTSISKFDQGWTGSRLRGPNLVARPVTIQPWRSSHVRSAKQERFGHPRKAKFFKQTL